MLLKQKVQYGIFETYFVGMEETLSTTTRKTRCCFPDILIILYQDAGCTMNNKCPCSTLLDLNVVKLALCTVLKCNWVLESIAIDTYPQETGETFVNLDY